MQKQTLAANVEIYLGTCEEVLPTLPRVGGLITDPPYGITDKHDSGAKGRRFPGTWKGRGHTKSIQRRSYTDEWDYGKPSKETFELILNAADKVLIFGGNYFSDLLPQSNHWLIWDKDNSLPSHSDCELIWTNLNLRAVKQVRVPYSGLKGREKLRLHPTQKPLKLMNWLVAYLAEADVILDPYCGSGSTGVAAVSYGKGFIGVEAESKYFDIACKRIETALRKPSLIIQREQRMIKPEFLRSVNKDPIDTQWQCKMARKIELRIRRHESKKHGVWFTLNLIEAGIETQLLKSRSIVKIDRLKWETIDRLKEQGWSWAFSLQSDSSSTEKDCDHEKIRT